MPGHYMGYQQALASAPEGSFKRPETPSQSFGSNVQIGFGQGQVDPGLAAAVQQQQGVTPQLAQQQAQQQFTGPFIPDQQQQTGVTALTGSSGTDDEGTDDKDDKKDDETLIQKIQNVLTGDEIKQLNPDQIAKAQQIINQFQKLNLNPLQLRSVMISNLFGGLTGKDQTYTDLEGNTVNPAFVRELDDGSLEGLVKGEFINIRKTREGILDQLGSDTVQSLEKFAPDLIFGTDIGVMPATSGSLLTVANNPVAQAVRDATGKITGYITADGREISKEQGDKYNESIFAARAELDRMGKNTTTGTSNQGIMASSPAFATPASQYGIFIGKPGPFIGNFVDTDGDGIDDRFQTGPGQPRQPFVNPKAPLPGTSGTAQPVATGVTPFNINQFYASLPTSTYSQQGIMSPNLAQFYQNLGLFPRV